MQIKRFEAPTMTEALKMIKQEFGADAVILSARSRKKESGILGVLRNRSGVEVTAAIDHQPSPPVTTAPVHPEPSSGAWPQSPSGSPAPAVSTEPSKLIPFGRGLINALTGGGSRTGSRQEAPAQSPAPLSPAPKSHLDRQFAAQGIEKPFATKLLNEITRLCEVHNALELAICKPYLIKALKHLGSSARPMSAATTRQQIIAFVGPTGVGKTSSVAKLAAIKALQHKKQVGIITLDTLRIGAIPQLTIYARILGVPLESVADGREYREVLKKFKNMDVILVDTPGVGFNDTDQLQGLSETLLRQRPDEIHLVVSACTKNDDLHVILNRFRQLAINRILVTKTDESQTFGNIVNLMMRADLPLSYFTNGQDFPESIAEASLEGLADLILEIKAPVAAQPCLLPESCPQEVVAPPSGVYNRYGRVTSEPAELSNLPEAEPVAPVLPAESGNDYVVANRNSDRYHYPECPCIKRIRKENLLIFKTLEAALKKDFKACRVCRRDGATSEQNGLNTQEKQMISSVG